MIPSRAKSGLKRPFFSSKKLKTPWKLTNKLNEWKVFIPLSDAKVSMDVQRLAASMNP